MADKVLVVEDEDSVRELLVTWLEEAGYSVIQASNGLEGVRRLYDQQPDLVVLDIMMPVMDGLEFCRRVREVSNAPLMILSALDREKEKVRGLELGADEYVVKPVGMDEFLARVTAMLRRSRLGPVEKGVRAYTDGFLSMDVERHEALVHERKIDLTPTEFRLLAYLAERAGKVAPVREILQGVWGSGYYSPEVVKWHVASLRNKLEKDPKKPQHIVTLWGIGYRYDPPAAQG